MPDHIGLFLIAAFVLAAVPGPDVFYITARGMDEGRRAALVSVCSTASGGIVLTIAAALGLSAILESSALAFAIIKYLGAAYLLFLGVRRLLSRDGDIPGSVGHVRSSLLRVFSQGFVIAVLNPKTALFLVAFLPQFVNPSNGSIKVQLLVLGLILVAVGMTTDTIYALLSGTFGNWLLKRRGFARGQRYAAGGIYLALGVVAAVTRPARSG